MKVAIATRSIDKIDGILEGITCFFQIDEAEIICHTQKVDSGVPDQPFGNATFIGAKNRVNSIRNKFDADLYISCEAGIENFGELYFNVQVVCIYDVRSQKYLWGKSSGWVIPSKDIGLIQEIGLDDYLQSHQNIHDITELLGNECSRKASVKDATWLALCSGKLT